MKYLLYALMLVGFSGCMKMNTDYSRSDLPEKFPLVQIGDSLEKVYSALGPPLEIDVNPDRSSNVFQNETLKTVDIVTAQEILRDTNKEIYLTYSRPKRGDSFYLYWITVTDGKVSAKQGPNPMD
jgi:hypothetical protein